MPVTWNDRMLDRDVYILWQFFESTLVSLPQMDYIMLLVEDSRGEMSLYK